MATHLSSTYYFALAQLGAARRNLKATLAVQATPLIMLIVFWLVSGSNGDGAEAAEGPSALLIIFPAIVGMNLLMGAVNQAVRVVTWRQQGIFRRLSAVPSPLGYLLLGDGLANVGLGVLQALLTLLFGVLVLGLPIHWGGAAVAVLILLLAGACFTSYGLVTATFVRRPDTASVLTLFTLLPMFFIGGGMGDSAFPGLLNTIGPWLPVGAMNRLLVPLFLEGNLGEQGGWLLLALLGYTVLFAAVAIRRSGVNYTP